jgi:hypothetical protein
MFGISVVAVGIASEFRDLTAVSNRDFLYKAKHRHSGALPLSIVSLELFARFYPSKISPLVRL